MIPRAVALTLIAALGLPGPAFALRTSNAGQTETVVHKQLERSLVPTTETGLEEPPWPAGTGREQGLDEFPREVQSSLRAATTFVQRVKALKKHLGISQGWITRQSDMDEGLFRKWRHWDTEMPSPSTVVKISQVLHVDPLFMMTGQSAQLAFRPGPPRRRIALLLRAQGMTQAELAGRWTISPEAVGHILRGAYVPTRLDLFQYAEALGVSPTLLEVGFSPPTTVFEIPSTQREVKYGFATGHPRKDTAKAAADLQAALLQAWESLGRNPTQVQTWARQIAAESSHGYPGLTARLLAARPGAIAQAVHYGLFSQPVADWLLWPLRFKPRRPAGPDRSDLYVRWLEQGQRAGHINALAASLAAAHDELEELFQIAKEYDPARTPSRYGATRAGKARRIAHPWDLIARFTNRARFLALLGTTPVGASHVGRIILSKNPEAMVVRREGVVKRLQMQYPEFSGRFLRYLAWLYLDPGPKLEQARALMAFARRGWVRRVGDLECAPRNAMWFSVQAVTRPSKYDPAAILRRLERRDAALRAALQVELRAGVPPYLSQQFPGLTPKSEDDPDISEIWTARNLLNRIVAERERAEPAYLPDLADAADVTPVIHAAFKQLAAVHRAESWPSDEQALAVLLERVAQSLPELSTGGLEATARQKDVDAALAPLFEPVRPDVIRAITGPIMVFIAPSLLDLSRLSEPELVEQFAIFERRLLASFGNDLRVTVTLNVREAAEAEARGIAVFRLVRTESRHQPESWGIVVTRLPPRQRLELAALVPLVARGLSHAPRKVEPVPADPYLELGVTLPEALDALDRYL